MRRVLLSIIAIAAALVVNIRIQFPADTGKYNWESRKEGCVKAIRKYHPDIIGLQEATFGQKSFLSKELQKYIMIDGDCKPGTLNKDSGFNPILFRADRFDLLGYGTFWLNEDQEPEAKGWDAEYVRTANWVKLRFRKSGQIIFLFNTHFDNVGEMARAESALLMVEKIKEIAGDKAVVFVTGDLNTTCDDKALKPLTTYLNEASETVKKADKTPSFNNFGRPGSKLETIDHVLYRNAEATGFRVVDEPKFGINYISDHYPICSEFVITLPKN